MRNLGQVTGFEWDQGNVDKSYQKHGIRPNEAEEVFLDKDLLVVPDLKHADTEDRCIALGKTCADQLLCVVFTIRVDKIRIISARRVNKKERVVYEATTKKHPAL